MKPHEVRDSLLEGACDEQRRKGKLPTPHVNSKYFEQILQRMDNTPKPFSKAKADNNTADRIARRNREAQKRAERNGFRVEGSWELVAPNDKPLAMGGSPLTVTKDTPLKKLLRHRIRLLQSKPDWQKKCRQINPLALQGYLGKAKQRHAAFLWREIIRQSNAVFGDWWKAAKPKKGWSYAQQAKRG